jgi:homoserine kinase
MIISARAPATTANLGPGFDCAAVALDLWNELEVAPGEADPDHLAVRAFGLLADPAGLAFRTVDRIPRERGLGSSAATVALGLVAGAAAAGRDADPEELLALGVGLEGHADNLAAALVGGACLTWEGRIARIADAPPASPIALVPAARQRTDRSRASLPATLSHSDAARSSAGAALLGAALASGSPDLFADATSADRLHEPQRAACVPLLHAVRSALPAGALGATLSGSGPTVIVWARPEAVETCASELRGRLDGIEVLTLATTREGARIHKTS